MSRGFNGQESNGVGCWSEEGSAMRCLDGSDADDGCDRGRRPAVRVRGPKAAVLLLGCLSTLVACDYTAMAKTHDLCTQYEQLVTSIDDLRDLNPSSARAAELRERSDRARAQLDEFQAVSEGDFDTALSTLRAEVTAITQAAVEAGTEALDTARPLVEEALTNLAEAWAYVQDLADTQCGTTG